MKLNNKLVTTFLSVLIYCIFLAFTQIFFPDSGAGTGETTIFTIITLAVTMSIYASFFVAIVYILLGIPFSYLVDIITDFLRIRSAIKLYATKLLFYVIIAIVLFEIFLTGTITDFEAFLLFSLLPTLIFFNLQFFLYKEYKGHGESEGASEKDEMLFEHENTVTRKDSNAFKDYSNLTERKFSKKKVRSLLFVSLYLFLIIGFFIVEKYDENPETTLTHTYLVHENIEGCIWIYYDQPNAEPLEIVDDEIIFDIPRSGILKTSSDIDFVLDHAYTEQLYTISPSGVRKKSAVTTDVSSGMAFEDEYNTERTWLRVNEKGDLENCKFNSPG